MPVSRPAVALAAALGAALIASSTQAADLPTRFQVPEAIEADNPCADPDVLRRMADRFAWAERKTWHRGFVMASIENGRTGEHSFFEPGIVHREYCRADSLMTNGRRHAVYYTIEFGQGFASIGNYVDFCVVGLDPWRIHDEACRAVR